MKDLAPDVVRQRMVIEGTLKHPFTGEEMTSYCEKITEVLDMTPVTAPMCNYHAHYGWCAYMHWKESGLHLYSWDKHVPPFFSVDIYTCKIFNELDVVEFTKSFFDDRLIELAW
jgi:S-adenosylmethionine decarboxylase